MTKKSKEFHLLSEVQTNSFQKIGEKNSDSLS